MLRNQVRQKPSQPQCYQSPQPPTPQLTPQCPQYPQNTHLYPLQKTRTFSHKKLSLTSTITSPQANDTVRKVIIPSFQVNKFYRPGNKGNCLAQSKKTIEESKVSLKLSCSGVGVGAEVRTPEKLAVGDGRGDLDRVRAEVMEFMSSRLGSLTNQINSQALVINTLKQRIQSLQLQIITKTHQISTLTQKPPSPQIPQHIHSHLTDLQKILTLLCTESTKSQQSLNTKLDTLTRKLVQMNITNQSKEIHRLRDKMEEWMKRKEEVLSSVEEVCWGLDGRLRAIGEVRGLVEVVGGRVGELEKNIRANREREIERERERERECGMRIMETKDTIQCWDTFEDYILTNRSQHQLKNNSIFSQDDYFFHPSPPHLKQSLSSCQSTSSSSSHPLTPQFSPLSLSPPTSSSTFNQLISIMQDLKQQYHSTQLPIKCQIDQHSRILVQGSGRLLRNQATRNCYKVGVEEIGILVDRGYIQVIQEQ